MKVLHASPAIAAAVLWCGETSPASDSVRSQQLATAQNRVASLSARIQGPQTLTLTQYIADRNRVSEEIHRVVDEFVITAFDVTNADSRNIASDLRQILKAHEYNLEYSGPPFALVTRSDAPRSLVIGYMLVRGGGAANESSVSIRGYSAQGDAFRLVDSTGGDFDGYGLFIRELPSPTLNETWLLVWGPKSGFNGNRTRIRVYAFDGTRFRTVWSPEDAYNVKIAVLDRGFRVEHLDEYRYYKLIRPPYFLVDEYILTVDGIEKVSSYYPPQ